MVFDAVSNHQGGVLSMAVFQRTSESQPTVARPAAGRDNPFALFEQSPGLAEAV
jgi:hypothetical protein